MRKICPTYLPAFEASNEILKLHLLNMFAMKKELFDEYCRGFFQFWRKLRIL